MKEHTAQDGMKPPLVVRGRRTLLKSLVAGSGVVSGSRILPENWSKPLTDAVILPSHRRTTGDWNVGDFEKQSFDGYEFDPQGVTDSFYNDDAGNLGDYATGDNPFSPAAGDEILNTAQPELYSTHDIGNDGVSDGL